MKKKFVFALLFIFVNSIAFSQGVGIGNPTPEADLDIVGTMRLEHYTQADGKVLVSNSKGEVRWTAPFSLKFIPGSMPSPGINLTGTAPRYTGAYITLKPGGYLFKAIFLLTNLNGTLQTNQSTFVSTYLSDSPTDPSYSVDYIPNSAKDMSGSLVGPSIYGLIDGNVTIRNNSTQERTYYLWAIKEDFTDNSPSPQRRNVVIHNLASTDWGENIIYAIPIE